MKSFIIMKIDIDNRVTNCFVFLKKVSHSFKVIVVLAAV